MYIEVDIPILEERKDLAWVPSSVVTNGSLLSLATTEASDSGESLSNRSANRISRLALDAPRYTANRKTSKGGTSLITRKGMLIGGFDLILANREAEFIAPRIRRAVVRTRTTNPRASTIEEQQSVPKEPGQKRSILSPPRQDPLPKSLIPLNGIVLGSPSVGPRIFSVSRPNGVTNKEIN
ncbi:hypothetical protein Bbelb_000660 [Branchiostoma belcheri]|nr:hypothetical protein Bbelb_000660 [Branchiostoma belcheri]